MRRTPARNTNQSVAEFAAGDLREDPEADETDDGALPMVRIARRWLP